VGKEVALVKRSSRYGLERGRSGDALVPVMKAADLRQGDDAPARRRLDLPRTWAIVAERLMGTSRVVVDEVGAQQPTHMPLVEEMKWSRHSRRMDPITSSANGFCQGAWGAIRAW
jgi:hypothetical protein